MVIKFVGESGDPAWDAYFNSLSASFASLEWLGKCGNPLQAYSDGWPEIKNLSQVALQFDTNSTSVAYNRGRDAVRLIDGGYKDFIWIDPSTNFGRNDIFMAMVVHEVLHGSERIDSIAEKLAQKYLNEHPDLTFDQMVAVFRIFEEAVVRKYGGWDGRVESILDSSRQWRRYQ
ncbi:MAG: hypothetical protein IOD01_15345 [Rhodobacter sp.]|nr:hypothetical protein [Rhodobacter sp.]